MANNDAFYRMARAALDDDTSINGLVIDLGVAIESYVQAADEADDHPTDVTQELRQAVPHAERLVRDLRGALAYREDQP